MTRAVFNLAAGALCGVAAGLVTGVAARAFMRMVADGVVDEVRAVPLFTVEGSAAILVSATIAGAPLGALYAVTYRVLPGRALGRGALFGAALLALLGPLFFFGTPSEFGFPFAHLTRVALFALLFLVFGVTAGVAMEPAARLARRLPGPVRGALALLAVAGGMLVAAGTVSLGGAAADVYGALAVWLYAPWLVAVLALAVRRARARPALPHPG